MLGTLWFGLTGDGEGHGPPGTVLTPLYNKVKGTEVGHYFRFDESYQHWGQIWFDAIFFSFMVIVALAIVAIVTSLVLRRQEKVPRGFQNVVEMVVELLNKMVVSFIGPHGTRYLPYLGTVFVYILCLNIIGIIPAFRSPTMTASTTLALGLTTIIVVHSYAIRVNGLGGYLKHFMGPVLWLAPLMFLVEIIGELAKPASLTLRLFGNIFGEDNVIEHLIQLGGWIPLQFPMLLFAVFTSVLQAFIFTALSCIYISILTSHEEGAHEGGDASH